MSIVVYFNSKRNSRTRTKSLVDVSSPVLHECTLNVDRKILFIFFYTCKLTNAFFRLISLPLVHVSINFLSKHNSSEKGRRRCTEKSIENHNNNSMNANIPFSCLLSSLRRYAFFAFVSTTIAIERAFLLYGFVWRYVLELMYPIDWINVN